MSCTPKVDEQFLETLFAQRPAHGDLDPRMRMAGETLMVTGAGGFIGSRLCMEIAKQAPKLMILVDHDEYSLYMAHQQLAAYLGEDRVVPVLGCYGDQRMITRLVKTWKPRTVYHAGAYKHVPLVERNPVSAVQNNVLYAKNLIEVLEGYGLPELVVVSSDKAVNPTNVMGCTKRVVEQIALTADIQSVTVVRFGNVLWSSGSVLPLFKEQLLSGVPVSLTHPDVTRFFMSVGQAVQLVVQAQLLGPGVFAFSMGEPVRISWLIDRLADHLGVHDYGVRVAGLRPGEKLHEELTLGTGMVETDHPMIQQSAGEPPLDRVTLGRHLRALTWAVQEHSPGAIRHELQQMIPEYAPACGIVDDVYVRENVTNFQQKLEDCFADTRSA